MAGFLSDSDEDKAVEELLSQAMDLTVLEQVAAINCAGFNNSDLPPNLETRFQKLKSFPSSTRPTSLPSTKSFNQPKKSDYGESEKKLEQVVKGPSTCSTKCPDEKGSVSPAKSSDSGNSSSFKETPLGKSEKKGKTESEFGENEKKLEQTVKGHSTCSTKCPDEKGSVSPAKSSDSDDFSTFKENPRGKLKLERKQQRKVKTESPSSFWDSLSSRSVSPPAKTGCFMCSPKKVLSSSSKKKKKSKENRGLDLGLDWGKSDDNELLSDLSNFSSKSQRKMMKKAMVEEEKICREAEKIVKWAKHASARMEFSDDEPSDTENYKFM